MTNAISFTSTYKVRTNSNEKQMKAFNKFEDLCDSKERKINVHTKYEDKMDKKSPHNWSAVKTLVVPEYMDNEIEAYCANYGIKFEKLYTHKLLDSKAILQRLETAPKGYVKVNINPQKLFELSNAQDGNIKHCKKDYHNHFEEDVELMLKSGDKLSATTLKITPKDMNSEELVQYLEIYGKNALNENSLFVDFIQKTNSPDHCVFFGLDDADMESIPVYVDKDTFLILGALDILDM